MTYDFQTQGTCSKAIRITEEDGVIKEVRFLGGCPGNTQGVARLVEGRRADEVISLLEGIRCGAKNTSCPDQLARALKEMRGE
jgi:uncharacterized protein (TIGR03905 family)